MSEQEQEWTICTVHRALVRDGSCSACGGDRHLVQVVPAGRAEEAKAALLRAQVAVHRYMVALGPHMANSWKELLAKECGLEIDEGDPYRHPKKPATKKEA
jgi:hypothetical protein